MSTESALSKQVVQTGCPTMLQRLDSSVDAANEQNEHVALLPNVPGILPKPFVFNSIDSPTYNVQDYLPVATTVDVTEYLDPQ